MQIILAYPWTDDQGVPHAPDELLDVPIVVARRLIGDGKARSLNPEGTVAELYQQAEQMRISLPKGLRKADLEAALQAAAPQVTSPVTIVAPDQPVADNSTEEDTSGR
jgi:hypothetical protein